MNRTVLIVDDSAVERTVLAGFLKKDYLILSASSGEEAIHILERQSKIIAAIIMDVVMTGMDGFETITKIRENPDLQQIPIIIATSLEDDKSREKAIVCGANGFISKPYNQTLLLHTLENVISLRVNAAIANAVRIDGLTGLLTREAFFAECERVIQRHKPGYYVMACVDIENFKSVNAQYGTEIGDDVLVHVAKTIDSFVSGFNGRTCHFNADRFAILYPASIMETETIRNNHRKVMSPDCINRTFRIRVGRYIVDDLDLSVNAMYDRAALATASLKSCYNTYIAYYTKEMQDATEREQQIVSCMESALHDGEFEPWFQPQYNHTTGAMIGAEALVRWKRDGKYISPAEFVPIFETNGFVYEMDKFIWTQVCGILRHWLDEGKRPLPVSVNISRRDLQHDHFVEALTGIVAKYDIPYNLLRLEITESALSDTGIIEKVDALIKLGFTVEIDDFGSGYSSLNTLKDVPASILKLDMRFFENTGDSQRSGNIIESVVRMAKWLDMAVIAEGVEDKAQADYLKSIGCYYIQGYYYARPMQLEDYEKLQDMCAAEPKLTRLKTVETLDNNEFWNPKSMETLIFNSYVGGACIYEYSGGKIEVLRVNDQYIREFGSITPDGIALKDERLTELLGENGRKMIEDTIALANESKKEASCEVTLFDGVHTEYLNIAIRIIARTTERLLCYCVIRNMTAQRVAEQKRIAAEKLSSENARKLEVIMGNVNGGVSVLSINDDGKSKTVFCNDRYYSLFGYTKEQATAENLDTMTCIMPEDFGNVINKLRQIKSSGKSTVFDYCARKRDGRPVYIRCNATLISLDGYDEKLIASVELDITEQRQMQDQLRAIIDNINGGISATFLNDNKPQFVVVNDRYYDIIGYTKEQFETEVSNVFDLIVPEDRERIERQFREAVGSTQRYTMEYRFTRRDGTIRNILCNTSIIHLFGVDEPVQLAVSNDVTELREAEQKERNIAKQMEAIMGNINGGVIATVYHDRDNLELIFANDGFYDLYGYTKESLSEEVGNMFDIILPEDRNMAIEHIERVYRERGSDAYEYRCRKRDGSIMWTRITNTVISLEGISDTVLLGVALDVTAEKEKNLQLQYLNDTAHDVLAQQDSEQAIRETLQKLLAYHCADRGYVVELDDTRMVSNNTYEVCADGVAAEIQKLQSLPFDKNDFWYDSLSKDEFFSIENVDELGAEQNELKQLLSSQNIHSIILAPIFRGEKLIAFVGVDNPKLHFAKNERLQALRDYVSILIGRRDLTRKVEHQQNELLDNLPVGAALYEYDGKNIKVIHLNKRYWELVDRSPTEYDKISVTGPIYPDDRAVLVQEIQSAVRQERPVSVILRILYGNDGQYKPFQITAKYTKNPDGTYLFFASYTVVSEHTMSVQELVTVSLSTMLSTTSDVAYLKDRDLRFVACSQAMADLMGVESPRDVIGKCADELVDKKYADWANAHDMAIIISGKSEVGITENIPTSDGSTRLSVTSKYPIIDGNGNVFGVYCVSQDVTKMRQEQTQLALLTSTVRGGLASYSVTPDGIKTLYFNDAFYDFSGYTREEYVAMTANDPLAFMVEDDRPGFLAVLRGIINGKKDGATANSLYRCRAKTGEIRWMSLSMRLMDMGDNQFVLNAVQMDVTEQKETQKREAELLDNLPCGAACFVFDGEKLSTMHLNRRYAEMVERVPDDKSKASVFDMIHPDDREAVRAEIKAAIRENRNISFDLRIICGDGSYKAFHTAVNVKVGIGEQTLLFTTFTPILEQLMAVSELYSDIAGTIADKANANEKHTVLIVDDSPVERTVLAGFLKQDYEIASARDGEEAITLLKQGHEMITAIVLDIVMPGIDGYETMKKIRSTQAFSSIPIVVSTSLEDDATREKAIAYGANGFVTKPYSRALLLHAVQNAVRLRHMAMISEQMKKEEQQKGLLDNLPCGAALYEYDGKSLSVIHINKRYWQLVERGPVDYSRASVLNVVYPDDRKTLYDEIGSAIRQTRTAQADVRILSGDGSYKPFRISAHIAPESNGKYILSASYTPITDQAMALQEILPIALSTIMSESEDITFVKDVEGRYITFSRAGVPMLGFMNAQDLVGKTDRELFTPEIAEGFIADDMLIRKTGEPIHDRIVTMTSPEGKKLQYNTAKYPLLDGAGRVVGIYAICRDVTEKRKNEFELNTLLHSIPSGVFKYSADDEEQFEYINRSFIESLGYTEESFKAKFHNCFREMIWHEDRDQAEAEVVLQESSGEIGRFKYRVEAADGSLRWIHDEGVKITDQDGKSWYYVNVTDITEQVEAERKQNELLENLKLMTDSIPSGLASYTGKGTEIHISYCNAGFRALFGITSKEFDAVTKANPFSYVHADDREKLLEQYDRLVRDDTPIDCIYRIIIKSDGIKWVHQRAVITERRDDVLLINSAFFDITELQESQEKLRISEEVNRLAISQSGKIVAQFDVQARTLTLPESLTPIFEVPHVLEHMPEEQILLGRISPETADRYRTVFNDIMNGSASGTVVYQQKSTQGWRWLEAKYTTVFANDGKPTSAVISFTDITEQLEKEVVYSKWHQSLESRPAQSYTLFRCNLSKEAVYESREGTLIDVNFSQSAESFTELTEAYTRLHVHPQDREMYLAFMNSDTMLASYYRGHRADTLEYRECIDDGTVRWIRLSVEMVEYPNSKDVEIYLMYEDITESKLLELQTKEQAENDPLTGILNRTTFIARMQKIVNAKPNEAHALLMIDIDGFKEINDSHGHDVGDQVLRDLTRKMSEILRRDDLIGRLGGDEFFVFLKDLPGSKVAAHKAQQICDLHIPIPGAPRPVTVSIGIALLPQDGTDFDAIYKRVDAALYAQKKSGKNGFHFASDIDW